MPNNYIFAICAIDLTKLDEKQKISPVGKATGRDGRVFNIDGKTIIERFLQDGLQIPLTVGHECNGKSAGWFSEFEHQADGVYALLRTNELGKRLIIAEEYKYLSPEYLVNYDTNDVERIVGVGLVNQPNLLKEALNHLTLEENTAMGNPTDAIKALQTQVDQLTNDNQTLAAQNAEFIQQLNTNKVANAINAGKLLPCKRDFALGLKTPALDNYLAVEAQTTTITASNNINQAGGGNDDANCPIMAQLNINEEA